MRKFLLSLIAELLFSIASLAQNYTTVTATVVDPNGVPYANARVTFTLGNTSGIPSFSATPTLAGTPVMGSFSVILDSGGNLSVSVPSNAVILPASTKWVPSICAAVGGPCATGAATTISGSSQDISTVLNAAVSAQTSGPPLPFPGAIGSQSTLLSSASVSTANVVATVPTTKLYSLRYYIFQAAGGTGCSVAATVTFTYSWTDPGGTGTAQSVTTSAVSMQTLAAGNYLSANVPIVAQQASAITYATTWTAGTCTTQPKYSAYVDVSK
jgi:hypothetical protein